MKSGSRNIALLYKVGKMETAMVPQILMEIVHDESGSTAIEYGLIAALISMVVITALTSFGQSVTVMFSAPTTGLDAASAGAAAGG